MGTITSKRRSRMGPAAVIGDRDLSGLNVPYIRLESPRQALTWLAAAFYNWPASKLTVIGVTGTDGKTTTSNLLYKILVAAGIKAGMISTVNAVIGDEVSGHGLSCHHAGCTRCASISRKDGECRSDPCGIGNHITWMGAAPRGCLRVRCCCGDQHYA
jgi:hypothetical protein